MYILLFFFFFYSFPKLFPPLAPCKLAKGRKFCFLCLSRSSRGLVSIA